MENTQKNGYINYQTMLVEINASISRLLKMCEELELEGNAEAVRAVKNKLQNHTFSVGIMGEFKRGKSTVINALLGKEILPADILPCSATLNEIKWDTHPHAEVHFKDGQVQEVGIDDLSNYVTKLTIESEQNSENVEEAIVYYPCQFCQNGVRIIDTPGLNDDDRMNRVAEKVLPMLDAIIMVIVPDAPFSISEADFVRNKVMLSDMARIIFVINKIDTVRARDRARVVENIKSRIQASVLEKTKALYGEGSREYEETAAKLGEIRVYPISAMDALDGKMEGDEELLEKSGMLEFEASLTRLLTEERGLLELIAPINTISNTTEKLLSAIEMRKSALELDKQEYEEIQKKAMQQMTDIREKKQREVFRLKAEAKNLYAELLPMVEGIYKEAEERLMCCVEEYPISVEDLKGEERKEAVVLGVGNCLDKEFKNCLSEQTEKIQMKIAENLGKEMERISAFGENISRDMTQIQCLMPKGNSAGKIDTVGIVADIVAMNMGGIFGLGGIIAGWKANGIPGALVGGGAGYLAGMATVITAASIGVVGLPMLVIAGAASTFGGKAIANLIFRNKAGQKKIEEFRSELRSGVRSQIEMVRCQRVLENWLKDATDSVYFELTTQLEKEVESTLQTTEVTMDQIKSDLARGRANHENILAELDKKEKLLAEILSSMLPIKERLYLVKSKTD